VVERPKSRYLDDGYTLELSRVCTAGRPNAASKLIAAAARAAFAMGARRVISYVLTSEAGTSYRAAGWIRVEDASGPVEFGGGEWSRPSRPRDLMQSPIDRKHRWERYNAATIEDVQRAAAVIVARLSPRRAAQQKEFHMDAKQATQAPPKTSTSIDWVKVINSAFVTTAFQWLGQAIAAAEKHERAAQASRPVETQSKFEHPFATVEDDAADDDETESAADEEAVKAAAVLGVAADASEGEIRKALRSRLASSRIHPDQGGDGEEAKRVIAAKNLLIERQRAVRK
jgi:hypothetical protein